MNKTYKLYFIKIYLGIYLKRSWDARSLWRKGTLHVAIIHKLFLRNTFLDRKMFLVEAERSLVKNGVNFLIWFLEILWRKLFLHSEWETPLKSAFFPQYIFWKIMSLSAFFSLHRMFIVTPTKVCKRLRQAFSLRKVFPPGQSQRLCNKLPSSDSPRAKANPGANSVYVIWCEGILFPSP